MTHAARTADVPLDFLAPGADYDVLLFQDDTHTTMLRETRTVESGGSLTVEMLENGGFTARLSPAASRAGE